MDSGNPAVCLMHFTNEGYDPADIQGCLNSISSQTTMVSKTKAVGAAVLPVNTSCPQPTNEGAVFKTPSGATILFEMKDPHIVLYSNFLSKEECEHLIELTGSNFRRSMVVATQGGESVVDNRSSQTAHLGIGQDEVVRTIEARIAETVHWPILKAESIQVIKYEPGQEYKPHYDFFEKSEENAYLSTPNFQRTGTMILYLQEPKAGGSTSFPRLNLTIPARQGQALFFSYPTPTPNDKTLHAGDPVIEGEKIIATKWFKTLHHGT